MSRDEKCQSTRINISPQCDTSYPVSERHDRVIPNFSIGAQVKTMEEFGTSRPLRRALVSLDGGAFALGWHSRPGQQVPGLRHSKRPENGSRPEKGPNGMDIGDKYLGLSPTPAEVRNVLPPQMSEYLWVRWRQWVGLPAPKSLRHRREGYAEPPVLNKYNYVHIFLFALISQQYLRYHLF